MSDAFVDTKNKVESALVTAMLNDPENVLALMNLARHFEANDRDQEADGLYRNVLALQPDDADAMLALGRLLHPYPAFQDEAIRILQRVVQLYPNMTAAYKPLATCLKYVGRTDEVVPVLRAWVAVAPLDATAMHLLAAYSREDIPDRASDAFVVKTFDDGAERFDALLRDTLQYRGPEALCEHFEAVLGAQTAKLAPMSLAVLDVGCGTGLCAPLLKSWASRLDGVDLSANMITKARARGGYDSLETAEITAYLAAHSNEFDLLFSADTLCYFGRLDQVLAHSHAALRAGGWLAFTVERLVPAVGSAAADFVLTATGRYQQSEAYVRRALLSAGFATPHIIETQLRVELNSPVIGLAVVAQKSS